METPRARSLRFATASVLLAALAAAVTTIPHAGIIALAAVLLAAFFAYLRFRPRTSSVDIFEVIIPFSVLNFLYFGVGTIYVVFQPKALNFVSLGPFLGPALALAVLGYGCFLVGYALFFRATRPSPLRALEPNHVLAYVVPTAIGALGLSVHKLQLESIALRGGISPGISLLQQFGVLFFLGWFLAWYMVLSGRLRRSTGVPLLIGLSGLVGVVLFSNFGGKALAMMMIGMPAIAYYEVKRRLPVKTLIVIVLISVFVIFPLYNTFRTTTRSLDTARRLDQTVGLARRWDTDRFLDASLFSFMGRMSIVTSVAAILSDTPSRVDYQYGKTLVLAPVALFIPRFLWPDKPNISIGREFGATFRMTSALDLETEVAPSLVGEFYWNFAIPGVVFGMLFLGMGYRWYYQRYGVGTGFDPIRKSIYAALLPTALSFEGNFAMIVAGFFKTLLIIVIFVLLIRRLGWLTLRREA